MKLKLRRLTAFVFITSILQLLSCNKVINIDDLLHHPDQVPQLCNIKKITAFVLIIPGLIDTSIAEFKYDQWGNPVSLVFNHVNTGRPDLLFKYDKYHRLTDYYGSYYVSEFSGEFLYHYHYTGNRITADTFYAFGNLNKYVWASVYEYDNYERIIKITRKINTDGTPVLTDNFKYDNKGNLIRPLLYFDSTGTHFITKDAIYDDKVNIHRTNKIWMFIDRDYSINNPLPATYTVNRFNLPVKINVQPPLFLEFLYQYDIGKSVIEYDCK